MKFWFLWAVLGVLALGAMGLFTALDQALVDYREAQAYRAYIEKRAGVDLSSLEEKN